MEYTPQLDSNLYNNTSCNIRAVSKPAHYVLLSTCDTCSIRHVMSIPSLSMETLLLISCYLQRHELNSFLMSSPIPLSITCLTASYNLIELLLKHNLNQSNSEMTLFKAMYLKKKKKTPEFQLPVENGAYYLRVAREIWEYAYQPILGFLTERGIHSEVSYPLRTLSNLELFDFEGGFNQSPIDLDCLRPLLPPQTIAPWAFYLTTSMYEGNPFCE